ncbi:MAG TPA: ABC transporter permease [Candidatus Solibacter sp.]|nr:ABC transporter permease [Candidatus Solibacter sp.]
MSATSLPISNVGAASMEMSSAKLWRAYATEIKFECLRAMRAPAFSIPFLLLPIVLYVLFGVLLAGNMSHGDPTVAKIMFVNWAVFGVMGPGMFGFGMFVATEREQGLMTLKRALPMPYGANLMAKLVMTTLFALIVVLTLIAAAVAIGHPGLSVSQYFGITLLDVAGSLPFGAIGLFIGTRASGKSAPAFANLAYLPFMHLGGLFYPLPKSVQPLEFISPAFYLDKLGLWLVGAPNMDRLANNIGPSSHGGPLLYATVLVTITTLFTAMSIRRLARVG